MLNILLDDLPHKNYMVLVYNIYRLVNLLFLFSLYWFDAFARTNSLHYLIGLGSYLCISIFAIILFSIYKKNFKAQLLWFGTVDIIALSLLIQALGYVQPGLWVLLNANIALLSILVPGRLAVYFASIASCVLLIISWLQFHYTGVNVFFYAGIYGAGFFATAITAWYLAYWIRMNEILAKERGFALENMRRINAYIIDRLQYGVIYVEDANTIKLMNKAAYRLFNYDSAQGLPQDIKSLSKDLDNKFKVFLKHYRHHLEQISKTYKNKINIQVKSALDFEKMSTELHQYTQAVLNKPYLRVHFLTEQILNNTSVLIIVDDMDAISQEAQQLKLASLGRFSAGVAHELRNPLGVIAHAAQLLGENFADNSEDLRLKELIINNCNRMNEIVNNVLEASRRRRAKFIWVNLAIHLEQFKEQFSLNHNCEINCKISKKSANKVFCDAQHLDQILIIICENAIEHNENKINIDISLETNINNFALHIKDNGHGINKDLYEKIFEPFFSTKNTSTGMGLFIARELCDLNQMRLEILPSLQGGHFVIYFNRKHELPL